MALHRQRQQADEQGAVAIIVAVFVAVVVFGIAALAIDGGSLLRSQRALVTDTDAMALAGARVLGNYPACTSPGAVADVRATVEEVGADNGVAADDIIEVEVRCPGRQRLVTVRAQEASPGWFSGRDDLSAVNVSTADGGRIGFSGLAICQNFLEENLPFYDLEEFDFDEVDDLWPGPPEPAPDIEDVTNVPYGGSFNQYPSDVQDAFCNEDPAGNPTIPGGWGWLRDGTSFVGGNPFDCVSADGNWCRSDTGTNTLNSWPIEPGEPFNFPVFDDARGSGSGGEFRIIGIGQAVLVGCSGSASNADPDTVYTGNCQGTSTWLTMQIFGFEEIDSLDDIEELELRVVPPPRICGVRATDGECVGF